MPGFHLRCPRFAPAAVSPREDIATAVAAYTGGMRISGILILVVLLAMAVVVVLQTRSVSTSQEALTMMATDLREEGVEEAAFDGERARRIIGEMERLIADPDAIENHTEDLKTIADTAGRWAAGAASPSPELHAAVALRTAAAELRRYAVSPSTSSLDRARRELERARNALVTRTAGDGTTAPSGLVTEGVRDRLHNLEAAQKERELEVEEELGP